VLSDQEKAIYSRHIVLPEIGIKGQEALKNSKVLVIGAGGLGCPLLLYLTSCGIGKIGIIDFDKISISNLHRQVLYNFEDIGKHKSQVAQKKLSVQNPYIKIEAYNFQLTNKNALELFSSYDIIIDGTDNFSTRYLVNDASEISGKPLVSGSIFKFEGQVSVFNYRNQDGLLGPSYRCLFPMPPSSEESPSCSEVGVLGVLPGIIGTLMANEVIKIAAGLGQILSGKMLLFNSLKMNFNFIEFERELHPSILAPNTKESFEKFEHEYFCNGGSQSEFKELSIEEFQKLLYEGKIQQLIDVREPEELPHFLPKNCINVPLSYVEASFNQIHKDGLVVVFCNSGIRSKKAIALLSKEFAFQNLYNLKGGIMQLVK